MVCDQDGKVQKCLNFHASSKHKFVREFFTLISNHNLNFIFQLSILINGSATKDFPMKRGLRQGDPISPFLSNIVVEGNIMFNRARALELIKGVQIGEHGPVISHLQFADDTIILCKCESSEVSNIKMILSCFQMISGPKVNFTKSKISGVDDNETQLKGFADILGCKMDKFSIKYLGLPLGANPRSVNSWAPSIERFQKKLSLWKSKYMTIGGRVSLIRPTLSNLPVYYMSLFRMPISVAKKLKKIQWQFLWGHTEEKNKLHLVG